MVPINALVWTIFHRWPLPVILLPLTSHLSSPPPPSDFRNSMMTHPLSATGGTRSHKPTPIATVPPPPLAEPPPDVSKPPLTPTPGSLFDDLYQLVSPASVAIDLLAEAPAPRPSRLMSMTVSHMSSVPHKSVDFALTLSLLSQSNPPHHLCTPTWSTVG
jgi:hypothetical protein